MVALRKGTNSHFSTSRGQLSCQKSRQCVVSSVERQGFGLQWRRRLFFAEKQNKVCLLTILLSDLIFF